MRGSRCDGPSKYLDWVIGQSHKDNVAPEVRSAGLVCAPPLAGLFGSGNLGARCGGVLRVASVVSLASHSLEANALAVVCR